VYGLVIGLFWKVFSIEEGGFTVKKIVLFNVIQVVANAVTWIGVAATLDVLIYAEPADKVYLQGVTAALLNSAVVLVLGTILAVGYSRTRTKAGSLREDA
jgi:energy-coupling factor transport system substrate-specific component